MDLRLSISSCMSGNMDFIGRLLAPYLVEKLGLSACFVGDISWQERERRFDRGLIQIVWICGLPYIQKAADPDAHITLLAAPVLAGARYGGKPVYYSDIVVHSRSPYYHFDDLRGATWAYNEPTSHLPLELQEELRPVFYNMHRDTRGKEILRKARFGRFVPISDSDYDLLRKMTVEASVVELPTTGPEK